jgi:hypothetical protein
MVEAGRLAGLEHQDGHLVPVDCCSGVYGAGNLAPPMTVASPSGSYRHSIVDPHPISCPASAATAANTSAGGAAWVTSVAIRRSAACSRASVFTSRARWQARLARTLTMPAVTGDQHDHRILRILERQREERREEHEVEDER